MDVNHSKYSSVEIKHTYTEQLLHMSIEVLQVAPCLHNLSQ